MDGTYLSTLKAKLDNIMQDEVFGSGQVRIPLRRPQAQSFIRPESVQASFINPHESSWYSDSSGILIYIVLMVMGILIGICVCNLVQNHNNEEKTLDK